MASRLRPDGDGAVSAAAPPNGVLRVYGGPTADPPREPLPPASPYHGRECAEAMLREALAYHAGKVVDYERLLAELGRA